MVEIGAINYNRTCGNSWKFHITVVCDFVRFLVNKLRIETHIPQLPYQYIVRFDQRQPGSLQRPQFIGLREIYILENVNHHVFSFFLMASLASCNLKNNGPSYHSCRTFLGIWKVSKFLFGCQFCPFARIGLLELGVLCMIYHVFFLLSILYFSSNFLLSSLCKV